MSEHREVVRGVAESLGLLDANGALIKLDSLMIVDLVVALEEAAAVQIPAGELRPQSFESLDSVAALMAGL